MESKKKSSLIYLIILTIITYLPVVVAIIYSFNASKMSAIWGGFTLDWYREVFADKSIMSAVRDSFVLGLTASVLSSIVSLLAVLAFRKRNNRFDGFIKRLATLPLMIPEIIFAMAYLAFFRFIGLPLGMVSLVIAHMSFCIPYTMLQLESGVSFMEDSMTEAAIIMGAKPLRVLVSIMIPSLMSSIISGLFLSFAMSFDDVVLSMFVTGVNVNTVALKIYSQVKTTLTPKANALCTLLLVAMLLCSVLASLTSNRAKKRSRR